MAKKKSSKNEGGLVCVAGCSVNGRRIAPGEPMPADADENTIRRLIAMGRFADADSDEAKESPKSDDDSKAPVTGADKLPGVS